MFRYGSRKCEGRALGENNTVGEKWGAIDTPPRLSHKLPIKVSKSCQKVAEFPKSCIKVAKNFLLFVPFLGVKD